jgi:rhamnosyltransferase
MEQLPTRDDISAVIVAYLPSAAQLNALVGMLVEQCCVVLVMDNGGAEAALNAAWLQNSAVRRVDMNGNAGLGNALNAGFEISRQIGVSHVVSFDQDSEPPPGMIAELAKAWCGTLSRGVPLAAVGPRFVDSRLGKTVEYPFLWLRHGWVRQLVCPTDADSAGLIEADFLITSGCMISLAAYDEIGAFDADMFVDCTDMEWGFRARARGYRLYGVCSAVMSHQLGSGGTTNAMGLTLLGYSPVRRYYYARNNIRLLWLSYLAPGWKFRLAVGVFARALLLPFAPRSGPGLWHEWKMFMRGVRDGMSRVGGPLIVERGD